MKKSKAITLVLVTSLLGCNRHKEHSRLYMRTDSTGSYTHASPGFYGFYIFRPYGYYYGGNYVRRGYANAGVHMASSEGVSRGGFGRSGGIAVGS